MQRAREFGAPGIDANILPDAHAEARLRRAERFGYGAVMFAAGGQVGVDAGQALVERMGRQVERRSFGDERERGALIGGKLVIAAHDDGAVALPADDSQQILRLRPAEARGEYAFVGVERPLTGIGFGGQCREVGIDRGRLRWRRIRRVSGRRRGRGAGDEEKGQSEAHGGCSSMARGVRHRVRADAGGSDLVVDAMVLNRDAGFVREGQEVRVKLEAFPFTRYGVVQGRLTFLSRDAVQDENLGLVFPARIELQQFSINVNGRATPLTAGLAATAQIRTGRRRIIEFLLSPLRRRVEEAGREK